LEHEAFVFPFEFSRYFRRLLDPGRNRGRFSFRGHRSSVFVVRFVHAFKRPVVEFARGILSPGLGPGPELVAAALVSHLLGVLFFPAGYPFAFGFFNSLTKAHGWIYSGGSDYTSIK
jgi:membrane-bound metal-dependent hydrolase YbcI (DUF457 family)